MLGYAARVGVTIAQNTYGGSGQTAVQQYLEGSGLLEKRKARIRLDVIPDGADEPRLIEGIRHLISE